MSEPAKDEADLIKCMAKAMHDSVYKGQTKWEDTRKFERYYREAEAEAALAAIRAAGWAVVPIKPTNEMIWAGCVGSPGPIYAAMLAAAPGVKP